MNGIPNSSLSHLQVNPHIRKEKWTIEEDRSLAALVALHGNKWADIAKQYVSARSVWMLHRIVIICLLSLVPVVVSATCVKCVL
jgi:hypothetical protein